LRYRHRLKIRCLDRGLARPHEDFVWDPGRGESLHLAWPVVGVAVELVGLRVCMTCRQVGSTCRHIVALVNDAAIDGWLVLRVLPSEISDGSATRLVARALASRAGWRR